MQDHSILPEHLQDLGASGITLETASEAGLRSVNGNEMGTGLGFPLPPGTTGLLFPYESDFFRIKIFPPTEHMRYGQPKGSGARLYVPPSIKSKLKNPTTELFIAEGEKKALKGCQEGLPCLGIGGLWNWLENGKG
ncbi:MAG: hypothetical protein ACFFCW_43570, partial [Candidatus Hodarchaeota archaeon]